MDKEIKDSLFKGFCWFCTFILMLICSIITGIDGIFAFIGIISLFASPFCLVCAFIHFVKNKIYGTEVMKERTKAKEERKAKRLAIGNEIKETVQEVEDFRNKTAQFIIKGAKFVEQAVTTTKLTNKRRILEVVKDAAVIGEELIKEQEFLEKEYERLINKIDLLLNKYSRSDFDSGCIALNNMSYSRDSIIKLKDGLIEESKALTKIELKDVVYGLQDYIEENDKINFKDTLK